MVIGRWDAIFAGIPAGKAVTAVIGAVNLVECVVLLVCGSREIVWVRGMIGGGCARIASCRERRGFYGEFTDVIGGHAV